MPGARRARIANWSRGPISVGGRKYDLYLNLPGASGDYASTPDAAGIDITGDINLVAYVAMTDWTPAAQSALVAKFTTTGNQRSYGMTVETSGALGIAWSANGTAVISKTSTANPSVSNGGWLWVRATLDVDNGASGNDVTFYTSPDGVTWTQLGDVVTTATATSIFDSTAVLEIGGTTSGTALRTTGKVGIARVYSGLAFSSLVAEFNPDLNAKRGDTSLTSSATAEIWTVNGNASIQ